MYEGVCVCAPVPVDAMTDAWNKFSQHHDVLPLKISQIGGESGYVTI